MSDASTVPTVPLYYRHISGLQWDRRNPPRWIHIGDIPADDWAAYLPTSAQTGERLGEHMYHAWWVLDYTVNGLHWPAAWKVNPVTGAPNSK